MKLTTFAKLLVFALIFTVAASGCRKRPGMITPIPGQKPIVGEPTGGEGLAGGTNVTGGENIGSTPVKEGLPSVDPSKYANYIDDAAALKSETIYFDFDSSAIKSSEQTKLSAVADFMKANAAVGLRVEGNCDERGTEEYNRSLGDRRAQAAREELARLGVDSGRILTVTYGEDRPADPGHDESAWSKNRRDEFIVLRPPQ